MRAKVPLQVYIDRLLARRIRQAAQRYGTSQAALVRRFIEQGLMQETPPEADPAMDVIAIGRSGTADLATRHDDYLAEAYRDHHRPAAG